MSYLKEGDVIEIKKDMKIYASIPKKYIFSNRPLSEELEETDIEVGEIRSVNKSTFDTSIFEGEYVVYKTVYDGGSDGYDSYHGCYPNGHHVFCQKLFNKTRINFYQSGCFTAMITDIKPIRKMKMEWREVL